MLRLTPINYVLLYCNCGEWRKIAPEKVYEPASLEWPRVRPIECPKCKAKMRPAPEYGQPLYSTAVWPVSNADVAWME